jgi:hypothetical protein
MKLVYAYIAFRLLRLPHPHVVIVIQKVKDEVISKTIPTDIFWSKNDDK